MAIIGKRDSLDVGTKEEPRDLKDWEKWWMEARTVSINGDHISFSTGVFGQNTIHTVYVRKHYRRIYDNIFNFGNNCPEDDTEEEESEDEFRPIAASPRTSQGHTVTSESNPSTPDSYVLTGTPGE